jgi:hypothetical protein
MIRIEARLDYDPTIPTKLDLDCPGWLPIHHLAKRLGRPGTCTSTNCAFSASRNRFFQANSCEDVTPRALQNTATL